MIDGSCWEVLTNVQNIYKIVKFKSERLIKCSMRCRPNLVYSPGPGLCPLSLGLLDLTWSRPGTLPGPDLGPGPELNNYKTSVSFTF